MNESRELKNAEQLEELLLLTEEIQEELEPVSYTHLDVYKRQMYLYQQKNYSRNEIKVFRKYLSKPTF